MIIYRVALTVNLPKLEPYAPNKDIQKEIIGTGREEFLKRQQLFSNVNNENKTIIINEPTATDSKAETDKQETTKVFDEVQKTNETIIDDFLPGQYINYCKIFIII